MNKKAINTARGETTYYTMTEVYDGMLTFCVKFIDEKTEREFSWPVGDLDSQQQDRIVALYASGFEHGRTYGQWQKSKRLAELFKSFKREII